MRAGLTYKGIACVLYQHTWIWHMCIVCYLRGHSFNTRTRVKITRLFLQCSVHHCQGPLLSCSVYMFSLHKKIYYIAWTTLLSVTISLPLTLACVLLNPTIPILTFALFQIIDNYMIMCTLIVYITCIMMKRLHKTHNPDVQLIVQRQVHKLHLVLFQYLCQLL